MKGALNLVPADFAYVRWLGNPKGIEEQTTTWDETVIDRQDDLKSWVVVLRRIFWKISASEKSLPLRTITTQARSGNR